MERAIIVGVNTSTKDYNFTNEIEELKGLCEACEIEVVDQVTQNLSTIHPTTYFGKGKLDEIKSIITSREIDVVVFNDELTPAQINNVEKVLDTTIYDRTYIILEIFKRRAKTKEAMYQVEIASLKYMLPRLEGLRTDLSRQGGGGGLHNRGGGETQLELDRRVINNKISLLKKELEKLTNLRKQQRVLRKKNDMKVISLVGYTNSGKSSTLNALLQYSNTFKKEVFEKDMVFATLETSTRLLKLNEYQALITDTVGFVQKLPHQLVEAFKSTLEEITESDLIVHVVDASNPEFELQIETTNNVLNELGVKEIPILYAFNKVDKFDDYFYIPPQYSNAIRISAKFDKNIDRLIDMMKKVLFTDFQHVSLLIPYEQSKLIYLLKETSNVDNIDYLDEGIKVNAKVNQNIYSKVKDYAIENTDH